MASLRPTAATTGPTQGARAAAHQARSLSILRLADRALLPDLGLWRASVPAARVQERPREGDREMKKRPPRATIPPPPGWTIEEDRREEFAALSELTINRKTLR